MKAFIAFIALLNIAAEIKYDNAVCIRERAITKRDIFFECGNMGVAKNIQEVVGYKGWKKVYYMVERYCNNKQRQVKRYDASDVYLPPCNKEGE